MKRILLLLALVFACLTHYAGAQTTAQTASGVVLVDSGGNLLHAAPNAPVVFCNAPGTGGTPCTNLATTYNSFSMSVACAPGQGTLPGTSTCSSTADGGGNFGLYAQAGNYVYYFQVSNVWHGPYGVSLGGAGSGSNTWNTQQNPAGNLNLDLGTYLSNFLIGDFGASPVTGGVWSITDTASSSTDTSVDFSVNTAVGSYHQAVLFTQQGYNVIRTCDTNGSNHIAINVFGNPIACSAFTTSPISKVWNVWNDGAYNGVTDLNTGTGFAASLHVFSTVTAAGSGFNAWVYCAGASATSGNCPSGNIVSQLRGDGLFVTPFLGIATSVANLPVSCNGQPNCIAVKQGTPSGFTPTAGENNIISESGGYYVNIGTQGLINSIINCYGTLVTGDICNWNGSAWVTTPAPSGTVSGQVNGQPTIGSGGSSVSTSSGAQFVSAQTGADESLRIRAAFSACASISSYPCHVILDEGGTQTWSVQPFCKTSIGTGGYNCGNPVQGVFEIWPTGTPLNILLDGVSTIQYSSGLTIIGSGETGSVKCSAGGCSNVILNACNPAIETCANGGFVEQNCAITQTAYSAGPPSLLTVTTNCLAAFNAGSSTVPPNTPSLCNPVSSPVLCSGNNTTGGGAAPAINGMWQYRYGCINAGQTNNNGCYQYAYTEQSGGGSDQIFAFYVNPTSGVTYTSVTSCILGCGTLYLDTPMVADNNYGNNGGTYENEFRRFTLNCNLLPGCSGFIKSGGEELTLTQQVQVFDGLVYGYRFDQSPAYGAQINGDTNDGSPHGPFSANLQPLYCQLGSCSCSGTNGGCSSGYAPTGSMMFCASSNTSYAVMSPDPCTNSNYVGALFSGNGGNAMPGFLAHQTLSISDFQGVGVGEIKGCNPTCAPGSEAVGVEVIGSGAHMQEPHEEYFNYGYQIGGDSAVSYTLWAAYEGGYTFTGTAQSISSATISSSTTAQITVSHSSNFAPGGPVTVAGITNPSFTQLNGTWTVASLSGGTLVNLTTSGLTTESATSLSAGTATPSFPVATAPTTSVNIEGGSNGPSLVYFDIGPGSGAASNVGGVIIADTNVGSGISCPANQAWVDNVAQHSNIVGGATDCTVKFNLGMGNNPPVSTGEGAGGFQGPVAFPMGSCSGGIGQTALTNYYLPPYLQTTTSNICTGTAVVGMPAPHACVAQNLRVQMGTSPHSGDTVTFTLEDLTTLATKLTCTISNPATSCHDTNQSHNYVVSQGDLVAPLYSPGASTDPSGADIRVSWDCQ